MGRRRFVVSVLLAAVAGCWRGQPTGSAAVVATINGDPVTALDFKRELVREKRESGGLGPRSEAELEAARELALKRLIERTQLMQEARRAGVAVLDEDVNKAYLALKADYPGTSFDELLADEEIAPQDLRDRLREQLMVRQLFRQQVFSKVTVSEQELRAAYETRAAELAHPEQVHAEQIVVKTEEEAQALLAQIRHGSQTFEDLARKHSLSPDARQGGDLGWFSRGMMPPIFEEICFSLPEGQVSEVVPSTYGFHLFKTLGRRPAGKPTFEEVRAELEGKLRREKDAAAEHSYVEALKQKANVQIDRKVLAKIL
jgi:peptidyl-prolyl cis-trans isomerase C/foldase protein PrsA